MVTPIHLRQDPYLGARLARSFVEGVQSQGVMAVLRLVLKRRNDGKMAGEPGISRNFPRELI